MKKKKKKKKETKGMYIKQQIASKTRQINSMHAAAILELKWDNLGG